jgi:hypothetical protein
MRSDEFTPAPIISVKPERRPSAARSALYGNTNASTWIIEPQASYNRTLGKGKLEVLLGSTIQQGTGNTRYLSGYGYNSDLVLEDIQSATAISVYNSSTTLYKYAALFGRLNYNWQDKYILNLTARRDGSSRFGELNRFHTFGSVGLAWLFSQENFIQNQLSFLSFGKLRANYGNTGNDQIVDYSFINLYDVFPAAAYYQNTTGLLPRGLPNPYLQWEDTRKLQMGIDLGLINDRILLNVTYARNRSSNQLLSYALPSITGFGSILANFPATVQNTSWEFALNTINIKTSTILWKSNINLTIPRNKLLSFPNLKNTSYANAFIIGQPISIIQSFHSLGVDPATGLYQMSDSHGAPTSTPDFLTDRTALLNLSPRFYGGIQNSVEFKGFQLDFLFQFVKQKGLPVFYNNSTVVAPGVFINGYSNQPVTVLDRWQKPGDRTLISKYSTDLSASSDQLTLLQASDAAVGDASYIRLKNLSLSWQLPSKWQQKAHFQNCRLYTQAQNLFLITRYKGLDPESQGASSLPPLRVFTLGLQVSW